LAGAIEEDVIIIRKVVKLLFKPILHVRLLRPNKEYIFIRVGFLIEHVSDVSMQR
jgi:hypothetical protein